MEVYRYSVKQLLNIWPEDPEQAKWPRTGRILFLTIESSQGKLWKISYPKTKSIEKAPTNKVVILQKFWNFFELFRMFPLLLKHKHKIQWG